MARIDTMTTVALKSSNPETYRDFFTKHNIVLSGTNVMSWTPSVGHSKKVLRIKQKVPTKTYCGINQTSFAGNVKINEIINYNINEGNFKPFLFCKKNDKVKEVESFISEYLSENGYDGGVEFNFLSENPHGHGFGFFGVTSVLISMGIYIILGKIDTTYMQNYDKLIKSEYFDEIHDLSWKIEKIFRNNKAYGSSCYLTMMNTSMPVVYFFEHGENIDGLNTYKYKLGDFLDFKNLSLELPLDYGIIYLGNENDCRQTEYLSDSYRRMYNGVKEFVIERMIQNGISDIESLNVGDVLSNDFYDIIENLCSVFSLKLMREFDNLFDYGYEENIINDFIFTIKSSGKFFSMIEKENKLISLIQFLFKNFKTFDDEMLGIVPVTFGKMSGSCMFVMKHNHSRNTLQKVIDELHRKGYVNAVIEYASRRDGTSNDGILIEQDLESGIYSEYLKKDNILMSSTIERKKIITYSDLSESMMGGFVLDSINKKIYLDGKKLTSKEILSQTTTIDLMEKLINNIGVEIPNNELEISSYSKNKNEMLGKIIMPLNKLIEKKYGKKLPLVCCGSLHEFYIKLDKSDLDIKFISKL